jgi:multicomponent Na+:H+ antiporter subunit G
VSAGEVVAGAALLVGSVLCLLAAVGLHRMPDLYARMHAATKVSTLGLVATAVGGVIVLGAAEWRTRLVLAVVLQFASAPAAAHLLGRAAHDRRVARSPHTVLDELEGPDLLP